MVKNCLHGKTAKGNCRRRYSNKTCKRPGYNRKAPDWLCTSTDRSKFREKMKKKRTGTLKDYGFNVKGNARPLMSPRASPERMYGNVKSKNIASFFEKKTKTKNDWMSLETVPQVGRQVVVQSRMDKPGDFFHDSVSMYKGVVASADVNNEQAKFSLAALNAEGMEQQNGKGDKLDAPMLNRSISGPKMLIVPYNLKNNNPYVMVSWKYV